MNGWGVPQRYGSQQLGCLLSLPKHSPVLVLAMEVCDFTQYAGNIYLFLIIIIEICGQICMLVIGNKLKYAGAVCAALLLGVYAFAAGGLWAAPTIVPLNLPGLAGERVHIPDVQGKLTWVNTWSTSCVICLKELPDVEALQHEYADQLQVVAIALPSDPPNTVLDVQTRLQLTLPVALDLDGQAARQFAPDLVVPRHHVLDANGRILHSVQGKLTAAQMRTMLEQHLPSQ